MDWLFKKESNSYKLIRNYQVSHVFGRTKNVYCFTAPWNIVYIPKIIDPFTGHEAVGDSIKEFTSLFQKEVYKHFESLINDYNAIMTDSEFKSKVEKKLDNFPTKDIDKFKKSVRDELSPIEIYT